MKQQVKLLTVNATLQMVVCNSEFGVHFEVFFSWTWRCPLKSSNSDARLLLENSCAGDRARSLAHSDMKKLHII